MEITQTGGSVTWTFKVTNGVPVKDDYHTREIMPREISIHYAPNLYRDVNADLYWRIEVTGPLLKKDGTTGVAESRMEFSSHTYRKDTPEWVSDLAAKFQPLAETAIRAPIQDAAKTP
jgi:hypothetical protein